MTLADTGPLVALIDSDDPHHRRCVAALSGLRSPLPTTWAVLTEAMHLLDRMAGHRAQEKLWTFVTDREIELVDLTKPATDRCRELIAKYADLPMDLADATLVALAEERHDDTVFTLDSDFEVYRLYGRRKFRLIP
jgi:Predicted nucleic acid-binding protein, contains PIN domain